MQKKQPPVYTSERRRDHREDLAQETLHLKYRSGFVRRNAHTGEICPPASASTAWKLEDAKAHFSEVVRRARTEGPQLVTKRGKDAVIVMAVEELEQLLVPIPARKPFLDFMESLYEPGLELDFPRERDTGREVDL